MKKYNRAVTLLLSGLIGFTLVLSGCEGTKEQDATETKQETSASAAADVRDLGKLNLAYPDWSGGKADNKEENAMVLEAIQKKFLADRNAKIDLNMIYIPASQFEQTLNVKLAAGEDIDAFQLWWPAIMSSFLTKAGLAQPIDDLLEKAGPNIKKKTPEYAWNSVKYNGMTWAIPQIGQDYQMAGIIRKDLLDKAGLVIPKNLAELENAFAKFKEMGYIPFLATRWYAEWTFGSMFGFSRGNNLLSASSGLVLDQQDNVVPVYLLPGFADYVKMLEKWIANGWLSSEYLVRTTAQVRDATKTGKVASSAAATARDPEMFYSANLEIDPNTEWALIPFFEGTKIPVTSSIKGALAITGRSRNAEAVVEYVDWLYSDPRNYYLAYIGIEGVHYTADWDKGTIKMLGKNQDPTAGYQGAFSIALALQQASFAAPDLHLELDLTNATSVDKKVFEYRTKYIYGYMDKLPAENKIQETLANLYLDIPSNIVLEAKTKCEKEFAPQIDKIILEGKPVEEFLKLQESIKKEWAEKYQQVFTDAYKKAAGK